MRIFACPVCGTAVYFHNLTCTCGAELAFVSEQGQFQFDGPHCANRGIIACNWATDFADSLCSSCAMTEVVPDRSLPETRSLWADAEAAKRWVLTNLGRWGWFTSQDTGPRPRFHLMAEATRAGPVQVTMGHAGGLITINVAEADPVERVRRRRTLGEPYRTMTGHFRHELAHFIFERLKTRAEFVEAFRAVFGDERSDYQAALKCYYENGPPAHWERHHVTTYASSHPHEDWAESFAHLLHLTDIIDSALAASVMWAESSECDYDAYADRDSGKLIALGASLGIALNHVNRAMGLADLYPFVLAPESRSKLAFVHAWVWSLEGR